MNNILYEEKKSVIFKKGILSLKDTFECGQIFRYKKINDNRYFVVSKDKYLDIEEYEDYIKFNNTTIDDFNDYWYNFFDFKLDLLKVQNELKKIDQMKDIVEFGNGIRILNQDHFETIVSFIISANNHIPRIKSCIEKLCETYGEKINKIQGEYIYAFPTIDSLSKASIDELRDNIGVGYRDKYIYNTVKMISENIVNIEEIKKLETNEAKKRLMKLSGVGSKVANCILLFSYEKRDAFPVDTWIKKTMEILFINNEESNTYIENYAKKLFSNNCGYAQQYLFYYGKTNKIKKMN